MSNVKGMKNNLIVGSIKKTFDKNYSIFSKPFRCVGGSINIKVDLSNYATKTDLKNVTHVDTSSFALKANLDRLKTEFEKLDIDKLEPFLVDLSN